VNETSLNSQYDVLLATGSSGGTISAVRELSKRGLRVSVISNRFFCPASWSRFAAASYKGPAERESHRFLDLLLHIGAASPGQVLLPTSDETAWLYTRNASLLSKYFRLHQPSIETMDRILDKKLLADAALEAGIAVLPTWEPRSFSDVAAFASTLTYPILIKPRTQIRRVRNDKGAIARSATELIENFREYICLEQEEQENHFIPDVSIPLLQHFVEIGPEGVYSVSGYIDETGELFVTRHAKKVLQRSQPAGVGVCFESLPTDPELSKAVHRLCRKLDFFGIFEVEFIRFQGNWAIIDFNPRLFNQAAMDCLRGMPLPLFAYLDAAGRTSELREAVALAREQDHGHPAVFYDRFTLRAILVAKTLTGRASREERSYWRNWMKQHAAHSVDFAADKIDRMPGIIHAFAEIILGIRAFRRFFRSTSRVMPPRDPGAVRVHP
jgi:predicted ATP-grasp superfamily ATP-dependent carboligase